MDDKPGKWVRTNDGPMYVHCSECGYAMKQFYRWRFCPMCGKRMEDAEC